MKQLSGRTALLTGASRGIGPTIANELAAQDRPLLSEPLLPLIAQHAVEADRSRIRASRIEFCPLTASR